LSFCFRDFLQPIEPEHRSHLTFSEKVDNPFDECGSNVVNVKMFTKCYEIGQGQLNRRRWKSTHHQGLPKDLSPDCGKQSTKAERKKMKRENSHGQKVEVKIWHGIATMY
jgi:hypothetical protein